MSETTISVKDEAEKLIEAAQRYAARRNIHLMSLDEATREMGAFAAGWNACREALFTLTK